MAAYFDTNSCAEYHWQPLHQILIKYEAEITDQHEDDVRKLFENDSSYRCSAQTGPLHQPVQGLVGASQRVQSRKRTLYAGDRRPH